MKKQKFKLPKSGEWPKEKIKSDVKGLRDHMDDILVEKLAANLNVKK